MKKVVLTIAVLGSIFLAGCEKDEALAPSKKYCLKPKKIWIAADAGSGIRLIRREFNQFL